MAPTEYVNVFVNPVEEELLSLSGADNKVFYSILRPRKSPPKEFIPNVRLHVLLCLAWL